MMLGDTMFTSLTEMEIRTETMHNELLELISTLSDRSSSVMTVCGFSCVEDIDIQIYYKTASFSSSDSLSMLQPKPQIFHGRESELENIVTNLTKEAARIAILGAGGMGKTSLARTALHHPDIAAKYESRFFVPCESAATCAELAAQIASHVGLKPGNNPKNLVVQYFSRRPPCLLILDNLETPWEPLQARGEVEEFLSLLTDVPHLALIVRQLSP
jgi:hypothetical protein